MKTKLFLVTLVIGMCVACSATNKTVKVSEATPTESLSRNTDKKVEPATDKDGDASRQSTDLAGRADSHLAKKEYAQAKALYDRISGDKKLKNPAKVFNNLALCEWNLRNYSAAVAAWERAMKADPAMADPYEHLGQLALKSGDYTRAEQMYRKLVDLRGKDANANLMWGVALRGKGDLLGAEKAYLRVLALDSSNSDAVFALAVLYHKFLGRNQEALGYYEKFTTLNPEQAKSEKIKQLISQARNESSMKTAQSKEVASGVR